ncbi:hypothetical protein [Marinoscillum sp.]|uniref:hypothetical protein n=1 Tax=Marinoscillum sp. TaxID=2024838 RepID=UPI003BA8F9B3
MIFSIVLALIAATGIILQFVYGEAKEGTLKKRFGLLATSISVAVLIITNINQTFDSQSLQEKIAKLDSSNSKLTKQLDICNGSISVVDQKQDSLRRNYDSLLRSYNLSRLMLDDANSRIQSLLRTTQEGFRKNEVAINEIEKVKIKDARIITEKDQKRLIKELSIGKGTIIEFGTVNTSDEAIMFSGQLRKIFESAGWETNDERWLAPKSNTIGILMFLNSSKEPEHALIVYDAIKSLGYEFKAIDKPDFEDGRIKIVIGFRE